MSQQSLGTSSYSPADAPVKRKRGRPRKDDSQLQGENTPVVLGSESVKKNKQIAGIRNATTDNMVGQVVSGVIEGSFDAGYLLNVKVGDTDTQLRGVIFLPGRFTPITAANDVAPNAKMYKRKEIPIPVQNLQTHLRGLVPPSEQINKQATESKMDAPKFPDQVPPLELQSGVATTGENQSDSIKIPSADNLQTNETCPSFIEKVTLWKTSEPGLDSQTASVVACPSLGERVKLQQISEPGLESQNASITAAPSFTERVKLQQISEPGLEIQTNSIMAGPSFGEKVTLHQISKPVLESQTASITAQLKHYKVVELAKVQQSNIGIEAPKESGPVAAPFMGIALCTENVIQEPRVEHQASSSDLKPSDLVHNGVKSLNIEEKQTAVLTEPKRVNTEDNQTSVLSEVKNLNIEDNQTAVPLKRESISSESIGIGFLMDNPNLEHNQIPLSAGPKSFSSQLIGTDIMIERQHSPRKETPENVLLELSNKTIGDNTSSCVGEPANFNAAATGSYTAPMTSPSAMMFCGEATPSEPKLGTEGSVLPRIIETQICSSSATTYDAYSDIKAAILNSHLDLSSGLNLSGSG